MLKHPFQKIMGKKIIKTIRRNRKKKTQKGSEKKINLKIFRELNLLSPTL